jgi:hypothetical protein
VKHKAIERSVQIDTAPTASVAVITCATVIEACERFVPIMVERRSFPISPKASASGGLTRPTWREPSRSWATCVASLTRFFFGLPSLAVAALYMLALGFVSSFVPTAVFTLAPETMPTLQWASLARAIVVMGSGLGVLIGPPVLRSILNRKRWTLGSVCLGGVMGLGTMASVFAVQRMRCT